MIYVILEWNQASGVARVADEDPYDDRDEAVERARELLAASRANTRRESYSVHEVDEIPEWQDEGDPVPANHHAVMVLTPSAESSGSSSGGTT